MRPISAILFDLDDTLLDAGVAWRAGVTGLIDAKAPGQVDIERGLSAWGSAFTTWFDPYLDGAISLETSRMGRIRHWADQLGLDVPGGAELEWFDAYVVGYRAGWGRFADVDPMLAALPPVPLGLVTNGDGVMQRAKVTALALDDRLDVIVVSDEFGTAKPDPAIFLGGGAGARGGSDVLPDGRRPAGPRHRWGAGRRHAGRVGAAA